MISGPSRCNFTQRRPIARAKENAATDRHRRFSGGRWVNVRLRGVWVFGFCDIFIYVKFSSFWWSMLLKRCSVSIQCCGRSQAKRKLIRKMTPSQVCMVLCYRSFLFILSSYIYTVYFAFSLVVRFPFFLFLALKLVGKMEELLLLVLWMTYFSYY